MGGTEVASFEVWARASSAQLWRAALLLAGNAHDADDLVQDTLVRVYAKWPRVRDMENPAGYAQRVLVNCHLSVGRRLRRFRQRQEVLEARESNRDEARDGELIARTDLRRALLTLGARQRAVVVLRYLLDLPDAQIADILGCAESTVRSQARRALTTLRHSVEIRDYDYRQGK